MNTNPMGTDGFEFVEYAAKDPAPLAALFEQLGFVLVGRHKSKNVALYRQGQIHFILNSESDSHAEGFYNAHGPSANAMAFRVKDAGAAIRRAKALGAKVYEGGKVGPMELHIPAIEGIGGSLLYLVDLYGERSIYDIDFVPTSGRQESHSGVGLLEIDHLTHNVHRGNMEAWAEFYEHLFGFRQIRYFNIEGRLTGLVSKAMTSPCGKIRIPINQSTDEGSQIEEYLRAYRGEGIQHIALSTADIAATVGTLLEKGVPFMAPPPPHYYDNVGARVPHHREDIEVLRRLGILIDGAPESRPGADDGGILLQIFTNTVIGPIFFEIIQRKGDEGFGEGNFQALFESIEQDQINRGVLSPR